MLPEEIALELYDYVGHLQGSDLALYFVTPEAFLSHLIINKKEMIREHNIDCFTLYDLLQVEVKNYFLNGSGGVNEYKINAGKELRCIIQSVINESFFSLDETSKNERLIQLYDAVNLFCKRLDSILGNSDKFSNLLNGIELHKLENNFLKEELKILSNKNIDLEIEYDLSRGLKSKINVIDEKLKKERMQKKEKIKEIKKLKEENKILKEENKKFKIKRDIIYFVLVIENAKRQLVSKRNICEAEIIDYNKQIIDCNKQIGNLIDKYSFE